MIGRGPKFLGEEAEPVERNWDSTLEIEKNRRLWGEGWRGKHLPLWLVLEGFWGSGKPLGDSTRVLQGGAQRRNFSEELLECLTRGEEGP